jgi:hypothetical protein
MRRSVSRLYVTSPLVHEIRLGESGDWRGRNYHGKEQRP